MANKISCPKNKNLFLTTDTPVINTILYSDRGKDVEVKIGRQNVGHPHWPPEKGQAHSRPVRHEPETFHSGQNWSTKFKKKTRKVYKLECENFQNMTKLAFKFGF